MAVIRNIFCTTFLLATLTVVAQSVVLPFSRLNILFAGDLMQHESQLKAAHCGDGLYSFSSCYDYIRPAVCSADIAIANLETTIGQKGFGGYPSFCAPDSFLHAAKNAGFDVLLFANNHCLDRGRRGALYTMQLMDSLGIVHCGVYRDSLDRQKRYPLIIDKKDVRIALLNYTYGTNGIEVPSPLVVNLIDKNQMQKDIQRARELKADVIIACMHWGDEYVSIPPKRVSMLADWLLEQGVTHVIGGHPHVLQPIEMRQTGFSLSKNAVVYSLGNLISGMYARGRDGGALLNMELHKFYGATFLSSLSYMLTWVARPDRDNVDNFIILPAAASPQFEKEATCRKLTEFVNDSRELFTRYNKGKVFEYIPR